MKHYIKSIFNPAYLRFISLFFLVIILIFLSNNLFKPNFYKVAEEYFLDNIINWNITNKVINSTEERITIIDIDEESLEIFGPWPWPRHLIAELIRITSQHFGAKSLGLDIIFTDITETPSDLELQKALSLPGVVVAVAFDLSSNNKSPHTGFLFGGYKVTESSTQITSQLAHGYITNHENLIKHGPIKDNWPCIGHITPSISEDGVIRHIAPWIQYQDHIYPMLAISILKCAINNNQNEFFLTPFNRKILSLDNLNQWRIPWLKKIDDFTVISAKDIFSKQVDLSLLKDRHVILGSTSWGVGDLAVTPILKKMPGALIHAQILSFLLDHEDFFFDEKFSKTIGKEKKWVSVFYSFFSVFLFCWCLIYKKIIFSIIIFIGSSSLWLFISIYLYQLHISTLWILPWFMFFLVMIFFLPIEIIILKREYGIKILRISKYLSPKVVNILLTNDGPTYLIPQRTTISVLFADVANYTNLSEKISPENLSILTKDIQTELTNAINKYNGTVEKYLGDAVTALWGAPLKQDNHADLAIQCALEMQNRIKLKSENWQNQYGLREEISLYIGINTGEAIVGSMEYANRNTYTAIGDTVNTAARLQELAKVLCQPILLGSKSAKASQLTGIIFLTELILRNKEIPEKIYCLR